MDVGGEDGLRGLREHARGGVWADRRTGRQTTGRAVPLDSLGGQRAGGWGESQKHRHTTTYTPKKAQASSLFLTLIQFSILLWPNPFLSVS